MDKRKTRIAALGLILVGVVVFLAAQTNDRNREKPSPQVLFEKIRNSLSEARLKISNAQEDIAKLQSEAGLLQGTQSPIKVRGGAMTFRYNADALGHTQWYRYGANGWCVPLDTTGGQVELTIRTDPDPDPDSETDSMHTTYTLKAPWKVVLHGRKPDFTSDLNEGIVLTSTATCNSNQNGIALASLDNAVTSFYPSDLPYDGQTYTKRYQHTSCNGADEDKCEHMGNVDVTTNGKVKTPIDCENGECIVKIVP